jgi:enoyl-CoA hydratase/carnithine racemase
MVQGFCIGGGLALALAADLRIADRSAVFSLPPARLGLAYPLDGLSDLVATVGAPAAKEMIFTAAKLTAEDAFRIGLIDRLATDIETETRSLAAEIAAGAPLTITHAKKAIDFLAKRPGHEDDAEIAWLAARCFDSEDYAEGRAAFMEKRRPLFRGS